SDTKNYGELLDVVRRILPLAAKSGESAKKREFDVLLSSLSALDVPPDIRPTLLYHVAKAAANNGNSKLAESWLKEPMKNADDPVVKSRAHYVRALIYLNQRNFALAEATLDKVMAIENKNGASADSVKDLARLALGRIAIHRKKPTTAIKFYSKVEATSSSFKEALFERIYLLLELKRDEDARGKAVLFLARYPNTAEADQIRMVIAYLDLRAGDTAAAGATLRASDE